MANLYGMDTRARKSKGKRKNKHTKKKKPMEAPMCRLCETRHWSNQPHKLNANEPYPDKWCC